MTWEYPESYCLIIVVLNKPRGLKYEESRRGTFNPTGSYHVILRGQSDGSHQTGSSHPRLSFPRFDDGELIGNKLFQPQTVPAVDRSWRQRSSNVNCSMRMLFCRSEKSSMDVWKLTMYHVKIRFKPSPCLWRFATIMKERC